MQHRFCNKVLVFLHFLKYTDCFRKNGNGLSLSWPPLTSKRLCYCQGDTSCFPCSVYFGHFLQDLIIFILAICFCLIFQACICFSGTISQQPGSLGECLRTEYHFANSQNNHKNISAWVHMTSAFSPCGRGNLKTHWWARNLNKVS